MYSADAIAIHAPQAGAQKMGGTVQAVHSH